MQQHAMFLNMQCQAAEALKSTPVGDWGQEADAIQLPGTWDLPVWLAVVQTEKPQAPH